MRYSSGGTQLGGWYVGAPPRFPRATLYAPSLITKVLHVLVDLVQHIGGPDQ